MLNKKTIQLNKIFILSIIFLAFSALPLFAAQVQQAPSQQVVVQQPVQQQQVQIQQQPVVQGQYPATTYSQNTVPANVRVAPQTGPNVVNYTPDIDLQSNASRSIISLTKSLLGTIQLIGIGIGLIMLVIIGIRSILSADQKAQDIKTIVINFVFGAACIFGATTILSFIQQIVLKFSSVV